MSADSNILPFPTRADAPVTVLPSPETPTPRRHFGLRPPTREAMELARQADRRLEYLRRAGQAAADALQGITEDKRKHAHADLHKDFAARLEGHARSIRCAVEEAQSLGHEPQRVTLDCIAELLETLAGEIAVFVEKLK